MDPAVANQNLDPPDERVLAPGLLPAVLAHLLFGVALAFGVNWNGGDGLTSLFNARSVAPSQAQGTATPDTNDTARMGGAPTAPSPAPAPVSALTPVAQTSIAPAPKIVANPDRSDGR